MDSFVVSAEVGNRSMPSLILEFIRTGADRGTWSQIQVPKSPSMVTMGMWSQGPANPGAGESLGRGLARLSGDQSVANEVWLYSNSSGQQVHVATLAGFTSFPPQRGQLGRISIFDSFDKVCQVGSCSDVSSNWQDVSNRGFFRESNWSFDTSAGGSGGGFAIAGSSGSLWFVNPVLKTECELYYYALGFAIGLKPTAGMIACVKPLIDKIGPLVDRARLIGNQALEVVQRSKAAQAAAQWATARNVIAPASAAATHVSRSQPGLAGSTTKTWSSGWPIFYGPAAAPGELDPSALEGPCFMIDLSGSLIAGGAGVTAFFFNASTPFGLLSPPTSWSGLAVVYGVSRGLQFPGAALTFSKGNVTRGYQKP